MCFGLVSKSFACFCTGVLASGATLENLKEKSEGPCWPGSDSALCLEKRAVVSGAIAVGTILNGLAGFFKGINGPDNVKDVSI